MIPSQTWDREEQDGQHRTGLYVTGFTLCFDNVNIKTTARHQTWDRKNKVFNMEAYMAWGHIPSMHLSKQYPTASTMDQIPLDKYLPCQDYNVLKNELVLETSMIL